MTAENTLFENGLIQISAITTLLGASTAASLALGDKAAAGLPWAPISTFGIIHIARANLSATLPDWLREPIGLNNTNVEAALGKSKRLDHQTIPSSDTTEISAIRTLTFSPFLWRKVTDEKFKGNILPSGRISDKKPVLVCTLDETCRAFKRAIPKSDHKTLQIYHALPRAITSTIKSPTRRNDWIVLFASLIKLAEIMTLWWLGTKRLWWASSVAWLVSFCGALFLQVFHLSRDDPTVASSDILIGQMPTPLKLGGKGHIILGASGNVRHHWAWRMVWIANTIAVIFSLFFVFLDLATLPLGIVQIWLGFQAFYMLTRVIVYHLASPTSSTSFLLRSESWDQSTPATKRRSLQLLMTLAQYKVTIHPRGAINYNNALTSFEAISLKFASCGWKLTEELYMPRFTTSPGVKEQIHFMGVIPDTVLSTIAWAVDRQGSELYDAAILFTGNMAVPCVRVYTCTCEDIPAVHTSRGMAHDCSLRKWLFWIPYRVRQGEEEGYLTVWAYNTHGTTNEFERVDYKTLQDRLASKYKVSIKHVDEIKRILEHTREVARVMMEMFREAQGVNC